MPDELALHTLEEIMRLYIEAKHPVQIRGQANSFEWENDLAAFLKRGGWGDPNQSQNPDFAAPFNFDLKAVRADRRNKTFSISGASIDEATTGILPYRIVILLWEDLGGIGIPVDALVISRDAKDALSNWTFGIQIKAGITNSIVEELSVKNKAVISQETL